MAGSESVPLARPDVPWLAGAVIFGAVLGPVLLMVGLRTTPASATALFLNLEGVFTALLAWFVFRENVDRRIALGMALIVAGGVVLSWQPSEGLRLPVGALAVAGACLCWAIDNNLTQKVSATDPLRVASIKGLVAGSVNTALGFALHPSPPPPAALLARRSWASWGTDSAWPSSWWRCATSGRRGRRRTSRWRPSWGRAPRF
jgi:drug/metabolite transporter (DMT)-like permease